MFRAGLGFGLEAAEGIRYFYHAERKILRSAAESAVSVMQSRVDRYLCLSADNSAATWLAASGPGKIG
jgi:hypothetical protein